ncbi:MAG: MBL fold metallo-hydrolase [Woeseiaceae bacterium]
MNSSIRLMLLLGLILPSICACAELADPCASRKGVVLQVLGSGGPIADDVRASSSYLVWIDGVARVLIDTGAGSFLRFGESGASFENLDFVGLSHFHTDHSADFPALLKSGSFSDRMRPLHIAGPAGDGPFPGLKAWLRSMLDSESGAYGYLAGFLDGTGGRPMLVAKEVEGAEPIIVYKNEDFTVQAMPVPHGIVPAVAFKVIAGGETVVFASDQNGGDAAFPAFANGASILVMHLVVPEGATGVANRLHAHPSTVGAVAAKAEAMQLVLSHFMARSLRELDQNVALVRNAYDGDITIAEDLACITARGSGG